MDSDETMGDGMEQIVRRADEVLQRILADTETFAARLGISGEHFPTPHRHTADGIDSIEARSIALLERIRAWPVNETERRYTEGNDDFESVMKRIEERQERVNAAIEALMKGFDHPGAAGHA